MLALKSVYANGNQITSIDDGLPIELCSLPDLQVLNLANNKLDSIPLEWEQTWGVLDVLSGMLKGGANDKTCTQILLTGNPYASKTVSK